MMLARDEIEFLAYYEMFTGFKDKLLTHDAEQRQRIQDLEEWQKIVLGTGTDQEAVIRMSATEYTKVAIQTWKEAHEEQRQEIERLKSQLEKITGEWNEALLKLGIAENLRFELHQDVEQLREELRVHEDGADERDV